MYPIMININHQKVIIIGGGKVAARKIKLLLEEGAYVVVVSPTLHPDISSDAITWIQRPYQLGDLATAKLVFACTDDQKVNAQVMSDAHPSQLVNNTADKFYSDFYNVAIAKNKEISIMISTNGLSPSRSKEVRQKLESLLEQL